MSAYITETNQERIDRIKKYCRCMLSFKHIISKIFWQKHSGIVSSVSQF